MCGLRCHWNAGFEGALGKGTHPQQMGSAQNEKGRPQGPAFSLVGRRLLLFADFFEVDVGHFFIATASIAGSAITGGTFSATRFLAGLVHVFAGC